jgi:hypothetical protein
MTDILISSLADPSEAELDYKHTPDQNTQTLQVRFQEEWNRCSQLVLKSPKSDFAPQNTDNTASLLPLTEVQRVRKRLKSLVEADNRSAKALGFKNAAHRAKVGCRKV